MRSDFKLDNRGVHLPSASPLGFGKFTAKRGDFVVFLHGGMLHMGRVIGRVNTADQVPRSVRNQIMVAALTTDGHIMVRWVDPLDVKVCYEDVPAEAIALLTCTFKKLQDIDDLMRRFVTDFSLGQDPV